MTTNSRHTPGPWHATNPGCGVAILSEDGRDICGSVTRYPWTEETHLANVALITAAPDLYAALRDLVAALAPGAKSAALRAAAFNAGAAIAKAQGQT